MSVFSFAVRKPVFFFLLLIFIAVTGFTTLRRMPIDTNPEIAVPVAAVITVYPGATAREAEQVLTNPLEAEFKHIKGIDEVFSTSRTNFSIVLIFFDDTVNPKDAIDEVRVRAAAAAGEFPEGVWSPEVRQMDFGELPLHMYALTPGMPAREFLELSRVEGLAPDQIKANRNRRREILVNVTRQAEELRRRLLDNPHVERVSLVGLWSEEVTIQIDPDRARRHTRAAALLQQAIEEANLDFPAGQMRTTEGNIQIKSAGKFTELDDIADFIVHREEAPRYRVSAERIEEALESGAAVEVEKAPTPEYRDVRVRDFADVFVGVQPPEEEYFIITPDGELDQGLVPLVGVFVVKKRSSDIFKADSSILADVAEAEKDFLGRENIRVTRLHDASWTAHYIMGQLQANAYVGCVLVLGILIFFLGFRNSLLVAFAIPLSILTALIVMNRLGFTINQVTIFGFVLAIGMIVDDTIVVVGNIYRHRRMGKTRYEAAYVGPMEIGVAVVGSSLATMSSFFPIMLLPGMIGQYMMMIPTTVILAMTASLFVALFIAPMLCSWFLSAKKTKIFDDQAGDGGEETGAPGEGSRFMEAYKRALRWSLRRRGVVLALTLAAFFTALSLIPRLGLELFPQVNFDRFYIDIAAPGGSGKSDTMQVVKRLTALLAEEEEFKDGFVSVGSTGERLDITDTWSMGDEYARICVNLKPETERRKTIDQVIDQLRAGISRDEFLQSMDGLKLFFSKQVLGPPMESPVAVRVQGRDVDRLREPAELMRRIMAGEHEERSIPGLVEINSDAPRDIWVKRIEFRHNALRMAGTNVKQAGMLLWVFFNGGRLSTFEGYTDPPPRRTRGAAVAELPREKKTLPIWVRFPSLDEVLGREVDPDAIRLVLMQFPGNHRVVDVMEPNTIEHYNFTPTITIRSDVRGRGANVIKKDILRIEEELRRAGELGPEVSIAIGGEDEKRAEMFGHLGNALFLALVLIYLFLCIIFRSMMQPLIVLFTVPLALIGVVLGLAVTGTPFGMLSFIGIVALSGIVSKNAVVLVDFINTMRRRGHSREDAIVIACPIRMMPVFLTSATTILGILPLTLGLGAGGSDFWKPLGWAIIFGLSVALILTFFVIPVVYTFVDDIRSTYGPKPLTPDRLFEG